MSATIKSNDPVRAVDKSIFIESLRSPGEVFAFASIPALIMSGRLHLKEAFEACSAFTETPLC